MDKVRIGLNEIEFYNACSKGKMRKGWNGYP